MCQDLITFANVWMALKKQKQLVSLKTEKSPPTVPEYHFCNGWFQSQAFLFLCKKICLKMHCSPFGKSCQWLLIPLVTEPI